MTKKYLLSIVLIIILSNCGFKTIKTNLYNFSLDEITVSGDKKINFILKNKLKTVSNKNENNIKLNINSQKSKNIKEKNIKNEITKYLITISVSVDYNIIEFSKIGNFKIEKSRSYDVEKQYSRTITNEKNLIESLTKEISDEITNTLIVITNDL